MWGYFPIRRKGEARIRDAIRTGAPPPDQVGHLGHRWFKREARSRVIRKDTHQFLNPGEIRKR